MEETGAQRYGHRIDPLMTNLQLQPQPSTIVTRTSSEAQQKQATEENQPMMEENSGTVESTASLSRFRDAANDYRSVIEDLTVPGPEARGRLKLQRQDGPKMLRKDKFSRSRYMDYQRGRSVSRR